MIRHPFVSASRAQLQRSAVKAGPLRTYGAAGLVVVALAAMLLVPGWGVVVGFALLAMGLATGLGAPALLLLVAVPVRFRIPGPFHSVTFFELALPFALLHEVLRNRATAKVEVPPVLGIVGVFVAWLLLSGIWSVDRLLWLRSVIVLAEAIAIGLALYLWARRLPVGVVLRSWVLLGAFAGVAAVVWYFVLQRPEWINLTPPQNPDETLSQLERLGSPFWGPSNYFASMLLLFIPFGFSNRLNIWLRVTMVGLGVIAIIGTLSRGAALAIVIASPVLLLIVPRSRWPHLPMRVRWLIAPAAAIVAVLLWAILKRPDLGFNFFHDPSRASYYDAALRLLGERPIYGWGYGSWPALVSGNAAKGVHNYYLQIAVETGLIGGALFVGGFVALVVRARQLAPDLAFMTTAVLLLVAVNITVEASFEGEIFSWLLAMLLGLTLAWPTERIARPTDYRESFRVIHRH